MSQGMYGGLFAQPSILLRLPHSPLSRTGTIPFAFLMAIEKIIYRFELPIVLCQYIYEASGNTNVPVLGSFSFSYPYLQPIPIYVRKGHIGGFTQTKSRCINKADENLMLVGRCTIYEFDDILQ